MDMTKLQMGLASDIAQEGPAKLNHRLCRWSGTPSRGMLCFRLKAATNHALYIADDFVYLSSHLPKHYFPSIFWHSVYRL